MSAQAVRTPVLTGALVTLFIVGLNLRLSLTGITPVIPEIRAETSMTSGGLGLVTGVAVVMFGLFAPVTPRLITRFGADRVLTGGLTLICLGVVLRSAVLLLGMAVIGAGIALMNVVLPVIVKRDFSHRMALATAVYTSALNVGSAVAAAGSVPLSHALDGWRTSTLLTGVPAVLALVVWARRESRRRAGPAVVTTSGDLVWRSALAWQVTAFMGLQSILYYALLAWLPTLYTDAGMEPARAGAVLAVAQVGQLVGCIATPVLLRRAGDQRGAAVVFAALTLAAYLGFTFAPTGAPWLYATVLGLGQGGLLVLALLLIGVRAPDTPTASALSGMAQSVSYLGAAAAPPLLGVLHDAADGWEVPMAALCALCIVVGATGLLAGRRLQVPSVLPLVRLAGDTARPTTGDPV